MVSKKFIRVLFSAFIALCTVIAHSAEDQQNQSFDCQEAKEATPERNQVAPGAVLKFEFPDLGIDFRGNPAAFSAKIPPNYDPKKPVGLMIFLGGGAGGNSPNGAMAITNNDFVCVGLPYPDAGRNPHQKNMVGNFGPVWDYWKPMLKKLEAEVPNLDPKLRIIAGFSNGAHAIDGLLSNPEFTDSFTGFILIDGGGALGEDYKGTAKKPIYIAWGAVSPAKQNSQTVIQRAEKSKMIIHSHEMPETGHAFPNTEKELVKKWLYETVVP